jgi:hypothetical protein
MGYSFFDSGWHHPEASGAANRYEPGETVQESGSEKSQAPVTHAIDSGRMTGYAEVTELLPACLPFGNCRLAARIEDQLQQ